MPDGQHVVLVGLMGAGKSTVGRLVAERLGRVYLDNDTELEHETGADARTIAAESGLEELHREEVDVFARELAHPEPAVLGAPASVIEDDAIRAALHRHFVVWLDPDLDTLVDREQSSSHRPETSRVREFLARAHRERAPLYRDVATMVVRTSHDTEPADVADRIAEAVRGEAQH